MLGGSMAGQQPVYLETFFGFVKDRTDAQLLVDACATGMLQPIRDNSVSASNLNMRSGTIIVLQESSTGSSQRARWRDSISWSSSRVSNAFLLYREVEPIDSYPRDPSELRPERSKLFLTTSARPNTKLVPNGLAKRTITLPSTQDPTKRYRVINYFYPHDVEHLYTRRLAHSGTMRTPSQLAEFDHLKALINHPPRSASSLPASPTTQNQSAVVSPTNTSPHPSSTIPVMNRSNAAGSAIDTTFLLSRFEDTLQFGGSGLRDTHSFFLKYPDWMEYPVYLAPLTGAKDREQ